MCQCEGLLEKINEKQPNKDYSWLTSTDNEGNLQGGQAKMADQPMARSGHHQGKHFFTQDSRVSEEKFIKASIWIKIQWFR